jgi:phage terminase large subunit
MLDEYARDPDALFEAFAYYKQHPAEWIDHWCDTFDPRNAGTGKLTRMPFKLFKRQREFIEFLKACVDGEANGLIEKSRDMGATWLCIAFSVWLFCFWPGIAIGWGSRKAVSVDRIGDMNSIFEKMRTLISGMPAIWLPTGFKFENMGYMKITSPKTEASITGESGDDIGRGGRTRVYFKDESAHYEHPEAIEAALSDNTRVQIDISSVNGLGNVFHRKREAGVDWHPGEVAQQGTTNVLVMDWSEHPGKTVEWYKNRENDARDAGLLHVFRQEVDRNYAASVEGVVIPPEWVASAIDAHLKLKLKLGLDLYEGGYCAALDVADGGGDRNAYSKRKGVVLVYLQEWGERDTGTTARRAISCSESTLPIEVQYDSIGVGSGVKTETNRLNDEGLMPEGISFTMWDAGSAVLQPDDHVDPEDDQTPLNKDFYGNLKAQGWWQLRRRFEKTHRALTENIMFKPDELISLPSELPNIRSLQKELSQPTMGKSTRMKLIVNKMPNGTRSPNLADSVMMNYWPILDVSLYDESMDWVGG